MYKQKNNTYLEKSKDLGHWIKRKMMIIITAVMMGMSNAMYDEDKTINGSQIHTEQEHKKH